MSERVVPQTITKGNWYFANVLCKGQAAPRWRICSIHGVTHKVEDGVFLCLLRPLGDDMMTANVRLKDYVCTPMEAIYIDFDKLERRVNERRGNGK